MSLLIKHLFIDDRGKRRDRDRERKKGREKINADGNWKQINFSVREHHYKLIFFLNTGDHLTF
jgi:hypothetical protein